MPWTGRRTDSALRAHLLITYHLTVSWYIDVSSRYMHLYFQNWGDLRIEVISWRSYSRRTGLVRIDDWILCVCTLRQRWRLASKLSPVNIGLLTRPNRRWIMWKSLQMSLKAFVVYVAKVWSFVTFIFKKQIRVVCIYIFRMVLLY